MTEETKRPETIESAEDFASRAEDPAPGLLAEFWDFFIHNKKWWLTPIVLVLLLFGLLVILAGSSALTPFIYPFL